MAITYEPIATTTLGSAAASITFSSISGSYTDLVIVGKLVEDTGGNNNANMRFNNNSGSNYSQTGLAGNGSSASSYRVTNASGIGISYGNANSGRVPEVIIQIMNYSNSTTYKTVLDRNGSGASGGWTDAKVGLWRNTAAITTISFHTTNTNFGVGTKFTIYGIKAA
jgi:hypothetical protein